MRYATCQTWADFFEEAEGVRIGEQAIAYRLRAANKIGIKGRNQIGKILKSPFFSEVDVREACETILAMPQADESGFFEHEGEKYANIYTWATIFPISPSELFRRVKKSTIKGISGKARNEKEMIFYAQSDIRKLCASTTEKLPQANEEGFFEIENEKYGTVTAWARIVPLSDRTIKRRLEEASKSGIKGKDFRSQILVYYSESDVMETCTDRVKEDFPKADKEGFFMEDDEKYGTIKAWARVLSISTPTIASRLEKIQAQSIKGLDHLNHKWDFYSETDILSVCSDQAEGISRADKTGSILTADKTGFILIDDHRYATAKMWSETLYLPVSTITGRMREAEKDKFYGIDSAGNKRYFYSESDVKSVCAELLKVELVHEDEFGFFVKEGEKYGATPAWSKVLHIPAGTIRKKLARAGKQGIEAKRKNSKIFRFYSESDVRAACADLLKPLPQASEEGFFEFGGEKYGTVNAWYKVMPLAEGTIALRLRGKKPGMKGRDLNSQIQIFYSETEVNDACADLLESIPKADESGFVIIESEKYGTSGGWENVLEISGETIRRCLEREGKIGIDAKSSDGKIHRFFSESDILSSCADYIRENLPQADEKGFFTKNGILHGSKRAWSRALSVSANSLSRRVKSAELEAVTAKDCHGVLRRNAYYSEPDVREACADILEKKKKK